jgi:hypothetical protein
VLGVIYLGTVQIIEKAGIKRQCGKRVHRRNLCLYSKFYNHSINLAEYCGGHSQKSGHDLKQIPKAGRSSAAQSALHRQTFKNGKEIHVSQQSVAQADDESR